MIGTRRMICAIALGIGCAFLHSDDLPRATAGGRNPLATLQRDASDLHSIRGRVEERVPAGGYTYLRVRTERDERWAVTLGSGVPSGTEVRVRSMGRARDFYSRRLQRTFPELTFGIVSRLH